MIVVHSAIFPLTIAFCTLEISVIKSHTVGNHTKNLTFLGYDRQFIGGAGKGTPNLEPNFVNTDKH